MEQQVTDIAKMLMDLKSSNESILTKVEEIGPAVKGLTDWKPEVEKAMGILQEEVHTLRNQVQQLERPRFKLSEDDKKAVDAILKGMGPYPAPTPTPPSAPLLPTPPHAWRVEGEKMAPKFGDDGPSGHREKLLNRGTAIGNESFPIPTPANGMPQFRNFPSIPFGSAECSSRSWGNHHHNVPRIDFPVFDGEGPKSWRMKCESCFRICGVQPEVWVNLAALHCVGGADQWLQSTSAHTNCQSWDEFMDLVSDKFGKEEFQHMVRQFSQLKQQGTVAEYTERFNGLVFNLTAHHPSWDPLFFVTQFVEGLRNDIKSVVLLHRPKDLDTAASLACLQEEILEMGRRREPGRPEASASLRNASRQGWPIPPPPPTKARLPMMSRTDDRRGAETSRAPSAEDKWAALRAYRQARGLCRTCGEKWSRDHRCSSSVPLHLVEELMEILADGEGEIEKCSASEQSDEDGNLMVISKEAVGGVEGPKNNALERFASKSRSVNAN